MSEADIKTQLGDIALALADLVQRAEKADSGVFADIGASLSDLVAVVERLDKPLATALAEALATALKSVRVEVTVQAPSAPQVKVTSPVTVQLPPQAATFDVAVRYGPDGLIKGMTVKRT